MPETREPDVELRLPADGAYVAVLRTTTAALGARLDFTLGDIDDLRMAVGEAASMALEAGGTRLEVRFWVEARSLSTSVATDAAPTPIDEESFAWQVLTTLADRAESTGRDRFEITLTLAATPLEASS
jgi:serine/threonine-protein kinase RsbW